MWIPKFIQGLMADFYEERRRSASSQGFNHGMKRLLEKRRIALIRSDRDSGISCHSPDYLLDDLNNAWIEGQEAAITAFKESAEYYKENK